VQIIVVGVVVVVVAVVVVRGEQDVTGNAATIQHVLWDRHRGTSRRM